MMVFQTHTAYNESIRSSNGFAGGGYSDSSLSSNPEPMLFIWEDEKF